MLGDDPMIVHGTRRQMPGGQSAGGVTSFITLLLHSSPNFVANRFPSHFHPMIRACRIRHGVGGKGMQMHRNGRFQPDTQDQAISHQARRIRPRPRWATHLRPIGEAGPSSDVPADEHATSTTMCNGTTRISVCDKCGEFEVGDRPELDVSGIERGRGSLALCNAPGCGQTFAQCPQCERDYGRYCSTACRTLYLASTKQQHNATEQGHPAASRRDTDAGIINGTVKGQLRRPRMATMPADSGELEGPALLGGEVKEADTSNEKDGMRQGAGGDGYRWEGRTTGVAVEVTTGLSKGNFHTGNKRQKNRDFSVPEAALATSALEGLDGPAADPEPYASRHSTPESPRLAHVREATDRCIAGARWGSINADFTSSMGRRFSSLGLV